MLPKTIADSLRQGNSVEAEWCNLEVKPFIIYVSFTGMLPKTIADSLRQGNSVEAQWLD